MVIKDAFKRGQRNLFHLPSVSIFAHFCVQRYKITPYKVSKLVIILPFSTFLTSLAVGTTIICLIPECLRLEGDVKNIRNIEFS